jgi:hypothetical protein
MSAWKESNMYSNMNRFLGNNIILNEGREVYAFQF